jgi:hypothetical protein
MSEMNLNELLNTEEVTETTEGMSNMETSNTPAEEASTEETPVVETEEEWINLYDFMTRNRDKISNATMANLAGFSRVPESKYMLFCSNDEENASLILMDRPSTLWMKSNIDPTMITIENSGLIIDSANKRHYITKNNIVEIDKSGPTVTKVSYISRAKQSDKIKITEESDDRPDIDIDTIKLHIKKTSQRLYNSVKDKDNKDDIRDGIIDFMTKIHDVNHLIKIDKDLRYALSL